MRSSLLLFLLCALTLGAAAPSPEFVGTATSDGVTRFAFRDPVTGISHWIKVGDAFGDYTFATFDAASQTAELSHGTDHLRLKLTAATVQAQLASGPQSPPEEYVIKAGDSGAKIARSQGISLAELLALNPDVKFAKLHPGQKLRVRP